MVTEKLIKLKKKFLWLLQFLMTVATYCYYENLRRTIGIAIVSYYLNKKMLHDEFERLRNIIIY